MAKPIIMQKLENLQTSKQAVVSGVTSTEIGYLDGVTGPIQTQIGNLTTKDTNLTTEVNNLKNSVSNGKALVANAITAKGVTTATTAEFQTMANNIAKLPKGAIKSIQTIYFNSYGTYNKSSGIINAIFVDNPYSSVYSKDVTIAEVNFNSTVIVALNYHVNSNPGAGAMAKLKDSKTVTISRSTSSDEWVSGAVYLVLEFEPSCVKKVIRGENKQASYPLYSNGAATTYIETIAEVDPAKSIIFCNGIYNGNNYLNTANASFISSTQIIHWAAGGGTIGSTAVNTSLLLNHYDIIEFV